MSESPARPPSCSMFAETFHSVITNWVCTRSLRIFSKKKISIYYKLICNVILILKVIVEASVKMKGAQTLYKHTKSRCLYRTYRVEAVVLSRVKIRISSNMTLKILIKCACSTAKKKMYRCEVSLKKEISITSDVVEWTDFGELWHVGII